MSKMKGAKKVIEKVIHRKLEMWIPAGMAANGPPLGTMLGQVCGYVRCLVYVYFE